MIAIVLSDGRISPFAAQRLEQLLSELAFSLDIPGSAFQSAISSIEASLADTMTIDELLTLTAESLASRMTEYPSFGDLAGRVEAYRIKRLVPSSFSQAFKGFRNNVHPKTKESYPLVSETANAFVQEHSDFLDGLIVPERDYDISYFGMRTLASSYLLKRDQVVAETPQYLFLRVAVGIHGSLEDKNTIYRVKETYDLMSTKHFIHSSPTLFNSGTENNYLSSCFLMAMEDDSIDGIYKTLHKAALISKGSGGIGIHVHNVRASGSMIKSSNGTSNGLVPMLRVFNTTARYVDQGGNKRPGAIAIYLEPWHSDVQQVLELRKNHGPEELRARDLFYALWIPDLFMKRVKNDEKWSFFSPNEAPGLSDVWGNDFEQLYSKYERSGLATQVVDARKLWVQILETQMETGMPFMLYKDSCNRKSNQKNLGTIKSSNLCCEVVEYSSPEETAVCNLASLGLPSFVSMSGSSVSFDFSKLHNVVKILARNLDRVIDVTKYPVESARISNMRHRPIAIGVQGLADLFMEMRLPFESNDAKELNRQIFETIYHGAIEASMEMAIEMGRYESFNGSPASEGKLQFDLWGHKPEFFDDWDELKAKVKVHGLRNSLLVAPMPTASTSQILGFNECFEPFTSNLYSRRVLSGEFQVVNKYLIKDLQDLGIWNTAMKEQIMMDNGSIQKIDSIPQQLKEIYKTVWEISQKTIVQMAADRGCFIDQSQSMNIHLQTPSMGVLTSCHFYAWEKGLKTGMYYLRSQAAARAIQFTIDKEHAITQLSALEKADISHLSRPKYSRYAGKYRRKRSLEEEFPLRKEKRTDSKAPVLFEPKPKLGYPNGPLITPDNAQADIPSISNGTNDENLDERSDGGNEVYTIKMFDRTPVACAIANPGSCDSCSG